MAQHISTVQNLFQPEIYLEAILRQQAQQLAGRPGWPSTVAAVYQCLLDQIEADVLAGPCLH
ncbi:hypothetical protein MUN82_10450 [Hymenobacter aerilatus]|uniref:Uncharacterized protein n=1 Tax=Hymenobacter aerilatus TaxID=2932251 RepID=A0A8T9T042_9BACT|nr:hypothetical protein [Hymenobacter aerilatus]UOR07495.1 hypothetical protein MUN82_10450 [Hymenobacter aerilatus]